MKLVEDDYKGLLDKFNKLQDNNNEKKKQGIHDYSLINALLKKNDEVNLHSNFIYSMINPRSSHYCGNKFLELFLEAINETNFINLSNARVHKEKGKIDLLIEDGNRIIIIENKLSAVDQEHQISRYIQYVNEKYIDDSSLIGNRVCIVYLSEYKRFPEDNDSTIGFEELNDKSKELVWKNEKTTLCNGTILNLPLYTKLKFNRVQHSKHLLNWVFLAKDWLSQHKPNNASRGLDYAFDEYKLILKRLDTKKQWKNVMSLDKYTLTKLDNDTEKNMYAFMCEAHKKFNDYLGQKLYKCIKEYVENSEYSSKLDEKIIDEKSCIVWFKKKGNDWKNIGFKLENKNDGKTYIFELGTKWIYFGTGERYESINQMGERNGDIFETITKIENKLKLFTK